MFIAIRAWSCGRPTVHHLIEDWLFQPWTYYSQRKPLYLELVEKLRIHFRDPRPEWQFYADDVFRFDLQGYIQSWAALRDIQTLACAAGMKGFIILFDEFEDIIYHLKRITYQETAFWNLFQFYFGSQFPGLTFFAVTPDFVAKCKQLLLNKNRWDYDYSLFDKLPTFEMSPLDNNQLQDVVNKILDVHSKAYQWQPAVFLSSSDLRSITSKTASVQIQDRTRQTIREAVKHLDRLLEDSV
jgi:hypothetical protein